MIGGFLAGIYSLIQIVRVCSRGFRGQIRKVFAIEVLSALIFLVVGLLLGTVIVLLIVESKERRSRIQDKRRGVVHKDDA